VTECLKCHTPLPDNSKFCFACGADQTGGGGSATSSSQAADLQNRLQRIVEGKYKVEKMLGKGGMGAVYLAHDLTLDREVAIKVLPPDISQDEHVVKRFHQEAKTAAKLDHTNIIPIYRVESDGGLNYFVMKYISGTSLEDLLEGNQPMPVPEIQRILWEAACALGHAHHRGVVHRDVKPANIMFDHDGKVILTDFGISKALQSATGLTGTGMIIGTPHYMAPEQAKGQPVDGRADQYALGVVGYRMITGSLPFGGDSVHTILYKHIFEEAPRTSQIRQGIPPSLSEAIARALAKEPDQRYATMEEFATAVWPEQPVSAPKGGKAPPTPRPRPKPPVTAESPTEAVSSMAPTTPMPAARGGAKAAAAKAPAKKKSSAGLIAVLAGVVVIGVGGYVVLRPKPQTDAPAQQVAQQQTPAPQVPAPHPVDSTPTTQTQANPPANPPRNPPARRQTTTRQTQQQAPPPAAEATGLLTVASDPFGTLFVDGVEVGQTPVFNFSVKAGKHTIKIERVGYKTYTETVQVDANNTVRKKYTLLPEG
jgi:eukaryotic-like serine/threonine-protein kinase